MAVDIEPPPNLRSSEPAGDFEKRFLRLRDVWKSDVVHVSSTTRRVLHPAYQAIIGMGSPVLPLLFRELEAKPDTWFWALHAITEEDPAPPDAAGDGEAITRAWLNWAREKGYRW